MASGRIGADLSLSDLLSPRGASFIRNSHLQGSLAHKKHPPTPAQEQAQALIEMVSGRIGADLSLSDLLSLLNRLHMFIL